MRGMGTASTSAGGAGGALRRRGGGREATGEGKKARARAKKEQNGGSATSTLDNMGLSLGPIGLTYAESTEQLEESLGSKDSEKAESISRYTTEEWRKEFETDEGSVSLWLEDEYNAASRVPGGRAFGVGSGEGRSRAAEAVYKVGIFNKHTGDTLNVEVPDDRYILFEAEEQGLELPWACRMGCCTACAVRVKSGTLEQVQALGVSEELKRDGYALMCVSFPTSDVELELVEEDEVYDIQFGAAFAAQAMDPSAASIARDDYALELADMDE